MGFRIHICGAVHRKDIFLYRHYVVHDGEYGLFDLSSVLAACNDGFVSLIVDHYGCFRVDAEALRVALISRRYDYGEISAAKALKLLKGRAYEQLVNEQVL